MSDLPVLGVCLTLADFAPLEAWARERERDLELQDFTTAEGLEGDWRERVAAWRAALGDHAGRVGIHGPFWGFTLDTWDPDVAEIVRRRLDRGLDVCAELGTRDPHMVVHSPFSTWEYNNRFNFPDAAAGLVERVHRTLAPAAKRAAELGVTLVIENIEDKDPSARVRLAESFGTEAVKVSIDTGHAQYAHGSTGAPPVHQFAAEAGEALAHVHLQDADGYADRHWPPGVGTVLWEAVFREVARLEASPRLVLELRDKADVPAGAAHLVGLGVAV